MTRNLGPSTVEPTAATAASEQPPPAWRVAAPGWRDPRLWVGIAVVAASVLLGARLLAAADDTVAVWAVAEDVGAGEPVGRLELVAQRVRFTDDEALAAYHRADRPVDEDLVLQHSLGAGELLPRTAVGPAAEDGLLHLPLAVEPELVPPSVTAGSVVDVYLTGPSDRARRTGPALTGATVVAAPPLSEAFGTSGRRQLVVAVPEEDAAAYFELVAAHDAATPTVVKRG